MTTPKVDKSLDAVTQSLIAVGINMATAVPLRALEPEIWIGEPRFTRGTILLLGNGGQGFWQHLQQLWPATEHPVDDYSARVSEEVLERCMPDVAKKRLFPDEHCPLVLQRLMTTAGWHSQSPLGMGMHADYGLWSACRAVWWLDREFAVANKPGLSADHCIACRDKPCLSACPGNALASDQMPLLSRCADYRLTEPSDCANTCVAREVCPVAPQHRYRAEQLNYHYGLARSAIARYRTANTQEEN